MKRYNSMEVEVIKLSVCNIESLGLSIKDVLMQSVVWLREKYEMTGDARYLEKAVWHIYAYLELGYPYENGRAEFQVILDALGEKEGTFEEDADQSVIRKMESCPTVDEDI